MTVTNPQKTQNLYSLGIDTNQIQRSVQPKSSIEEDSEMKCASVDGKGPSCCVGTPLAGILHAVVLICIELKGIRGRDQVDVSKLIFFYISIIFTQQDDV